MLELNKVNQFYGESHTLWDLDLAVQEGECSVLMGRNGVGKTTLLDCVMGHNKIKQGEIRFMGEDISKLSVEKRPYVGIGYVPQGRQIFPLMTVEENLQIGLPVLPRGSRKIPDYIFDLFPVLKEMLARRGGDLSGGQQQQLAIARALVVNPKLLILDEPTEGIQPNIVQQIGNIIRQLNQELGLTVLLVEQKLPFARKVGDVFTLLDRGRNVAAGSMDQLDDTLVSKYLTV
ncbi:MAG: urea ABC transporter ATP-binding subunit UrtE [Marinobacterium sp.]